MGWNSCTPMWLSTWVPLIVAAFCLGVTLLIWVGMKAIQWWRGE